MAALQCDICGGKLMGRPGGIFECDSCGMEYDTAWAKAKIQEIKGTVKVEGTVEVTGKVQIDGGTVKVEGGVNIESFLKRGNMALEDKKWEDATTFFDEALNLNAECAEAYLGKVCAKRTTISTQQLLDELKTILQIENLKKDPDFQKALRFSDSTAPESLCRKIDERYSRVQEELQQFRSVSTTLRKRIAPAQGLILGKGSRTVGLRADGTVVAVGNNRFSECNVSGWRDIVAVAAGSSHTVGLKADGTAVAIGDNKEGQCNVSDWRNIIAIAAGDSHTVGLKADGTVVAVGKNENGPCNVSDWRDIVAVAAEFRQTVGLKADGTVVAVGSNTFSQCNVSDLHDIVAISAGSFHTVGLTADGTVVAVGNCWYHGSDWRDIVAVAADYDYTVGLKADGTVVASGKNDYGQCNVSDWKLFNSIETLEQDREVMKRHAIEQARLEAARKAEEARLEAERKAKRKAELNAEAEGLRTELSNLKGLFTGKRRKEIESRLVEIESELKTL